MHRAGLPGPGSGSGCGRLPRSRLRHKRRKPPRSSVGARQPEPVVNPGKPHWRRWTTAGRSPIPLITLRRSTRLISSSRYGSCAGSVRTTAYLIATQRPFIDQSGDHVETRHSIGAHVRFFFEVEHQANIGRLGKFTEASFQSGRIARICAGKRHHTGDRQSGATIWPGRSTVR